MLRMTNGTPQTRPPSGCCCKRRSAISGPSFAEETQASVRTRRQEAAETAPLTLTTHDTRCDKTTATLCCTSRRQASSRQAMMAEKGTREGARCYDELVLCMYVCVLSSQYDATLGPSAQAGRPGQAGRTVHLTHSIPPPTPVHPGNCQPSDGANSVAPRPRKSKSGKSMRGKLLGTGRLHSVCRAYVALQTSGSGPRGTNRC